MALETAQKAINRSTLAAFSCALGREAHVLTQHPDLLWQQLYNRLQWEEEAARLLASELDRRRASRASPWIKLKTPLRESGALVRTFEGHLKSVTSVAHSPNGRFIASISDDYTLRLWEVATGQIAWILNLENGPMFSVAFSPDGKLLACATHEGKLQLFDASVGLLQDTLNITDFVHNFAFSADWRLLVTPGSDCTLHLWEISTGRILRSFKIHSRLVSAFALSPDGQSLVSAGDDDPALQVCDTATGQLRATLEGHQKRVLACAFSPDGCLIASTSEDNSLRVWDAATGHEIWLQGSITNPRWCTFSPDGRYVASAFWGNSLRIWNTHTGEPACTFEGHASGVRSGAFLPDGRQIVSASDDNTLRLWEITAAQDQPKEVESFGNLLGSAYSPDGLWIYSFGTTGHFPDNSLHITDAATGEPTRQLWRADVSPYANLKTYALSPDGQTIVSHHSDNTLEIWEIENGQTLHQLAGHTKGVTTCAFSPDSRFIVSGSWDCTLRLWEAATGRLLRTLRGHQGGISTCTFSADGNLILSASADGSLCLWNAASGKALRILKGHLGAVQTGIFSPDGQWILSASQDKTLRLWQTGPGRLFQTLEGHTSHVTACAFSPDNSLIVSASLDKTLRVWSATSGQSRACLPLPGALLTLGMHPYKPEIVCGGEGGVLYRLEFAGYEYGPINVTARKTLAGYEALCPACQQRLLIEKDQTDSQITCPTRGCGLQLQINPFTLHSARENKRWLAKLHKS